VIAKTDVGSGWVASAPCPAMESRYQPPGTREALSRAAGLLGIGETLYARHEPSSMQCECCSRRWDEMMSLLTPRPQNDSRWLLGRLALMWQDGHRPDPSCGDCEGCWMELDEASRGLVLAHCGIHPYVGWGPAHLAPHPGRGSCADCRAWVRARAIAVERLSGNGFDPTHWLPPRSLATRTKRLPSI
jgi:hypothetical protein